MSIIARSFFYWKVTYGKVDTETSMLLPIRMVVVEVLYFGMNRFNNTTNSSCAVVGAAEMDDLFGSSDEEEDANGSSYDCGLG